MAAVSVPQPLTHWIPWDSPRVGFRHRRALCGALIEEAAHAATPTCPTCTQILTDHDAWLDAESAGDG